ncbi:tannase/feruloyl esterase family alpha/beta hydrolase (plasmid) [Variovorax sp. WS11]|nr:tannase/feruloyl esterase family alpha/beta hydrolase [Variovorax sp. WS11]
MAWAERCCDKLSGDHGLPRQGEVDHGRPSDLPQICYYQPPGVDHRSGGPGADAVNLVSVIDAWATQDAAPGQLTATKRKPDGSVAFTRPLRLHPQYPRYTGPANDVDAAKLASNYTCTSP